MKNTKRMKNKSTAQYGVILEENASDLTQGASGNTIEFYRRYIS